MRGLEYAAKVRSLTMSASSPSGIYCFINTRSVMKEKLIDLTLTSSAIKELIEDLGKSIRMAYNESFATEDDRADYICKLKTLQDYLSSLL